MKNNREYVVEGLDDALFTKGNFYHGRLFCDLLEQCQLGEWLKTESGLSEKELMEVEYGFRPLEKETLRAVLSKVEEENPDEAIHFSFLHLEKLLKGQIKPKKLLGNSVKLDEDGKFGLKAMLDDRINFFIEKRGESQESVFAQLGAGKKLTSFNIANVTQNAEVFQELSQYLGVPVEVLASHDVIPYSELEQYL